MLLLLCDILARLRYYCWPILAILAKWNSSVHLAIHSKDPYYFHLLKIGVDKFIVSEKTFY